MCIYSNEDTAAALVCQLIIIPQVLQRCMQATSVRISPKFKQNDRHCAASKLLLLSPAAYLVLRARLYVLPLLLFMAFPQ